MSSRHAGAHLCKARQGQVSAGDLECTWEISRAAALPGSDAHLQALIAQAHVATGIANMSPAADTAVTKCEPEWDAAKRRSVHRTSGHGSWVMAVTALGHHSTRLRDVQ